MRGVGAALTVAAVVLSGALAPPARATGSETYLVLAPDGADATGAAERVEATGGQVVASYDAIGVVVATSDRADFGTAVVGPGVESAAPTAGLATPVEDSVEETVTAIPDPATTGEPFWGAQWNMRAVQAAEAHSVTIGDADVVVGILDTGIDAAHPDLAPNVDTALSASCVGGVADTSVAAWQPTTSDHGTHVAGIVAATRNGVGVVGVAPGVTLAAVKVVTDAGFIYPEAAICGFMWAADHGFDVTNNSYFIDPWQLNCRNDPRQRPVWEAVQRAIRYASSQGVLTVASAGNSQYDLQHRFVDAGSPNDGSGPVETRDVTNACLVLPAEAPGVVTVSATGPTGLTSFYSSYGLGVVELAAPGGDSRVPGTEPNGRILSTTWPGDGWGYKQGTSMAAPHVAGVAALVRSLQPSMSPGAVTALLQRTADETACPAGRSYTPPGAGVVTHQCYGSTRNNGFYGHGEVNALEAVKAAE
ncbi:MAG: S8 family serine peptidase [Chloroflexota bacterium]|nr:S8 family serine peptidase [Chloroflexota bacterium]